MTCLVFFAVALSNFVLARSGFAMAPKEECIDGKQHYRANIRHIEKGGIGYEDGYSTLETFLALDPSRSSITPFLDARGHVFNNGKWATNVGVGLRTLWGNRAYGINTYYDYRKATHLNTNQIGVGLETLGKLFDFRINGYLPVGTKMSDPYHTTFGNFSGNYMLISQRYQSAMKGADAEFGLHFGKSKSLDFYAAAGPYYFIGKNTHVTWGGKAKIAGVFKNILTLEISDSYDRTFHNKFQGQISLTFSFGPKSKVKERGRTCKVANILNDRMLQPVNRQEIIVVDHIRKKTVAIDPATGLPYFFVFVNNTSNSDGTYESPYHSLIQAQNNSSQNNIIYVFPGDGTTTGMDSGITLKPNQKFWGSGMSHLIQTSEGLINIPAQSNSFPIITNTNINTDGNVIDLASNNSISGFIITSAMNDAIYGTGLQSLQVSSCTIKNTNTYAIETSFSDDAVVSLTNIQFLNNVNGVFLTLNGTSTIVCSNNTFEGQTSISSVPLEISATSNIFDTYIENNIFNNNTTGSIRVSLDNVVNGNLLVLNNVITNNGTGAEASLGSSLTILPNEITDYFAITLNGNTFSGNSSNSLYMNPSGQFTTLEVNASANTISNNGGSALTLATPTDTLILLATDNTITNLNDNGIALISATLTSTANITINNNIITNIGNASSGIALNQDFSTLNLTILNNEISGCEGTGIISYAPDGIDSLTLDISGNTISNCENLSSNAAPGLDIEQYTSLAGSITNNTFSGNTGIAVFIGSSLLSPTACLTLTGNNSSTDYSLQNPGGGIFNLSSCDVNTVNTGTINTSGSFDFVQSCSSLNPCP
jgi:hypothetical protein